MYIARVKILKDSKYKNEYYEKNKWLELFEYNDKKCYWRIEEDGIIEFVLGYYEDRFKALEDGKKLYFNILYDLHRNEHSYALGDNSYITKMYHEDRGYSVKEFNKNEEWFFNNKKFRSNFLGLYVFEIDDSINDYDKYYKSYTGNIYVINNKPFNFLNRITKLDDSYKYSKKNQEIFNLVRLAEETDENSQILLLCQALEIMGEEKNKTEEEINLLNQLIKEVKESNLANEQKESLKGMLEAGKKISSRRKCKNLIEKYCKIEYKGFNKFEIFKEAYTLRSSIIHGDKIQNDNIYYIDSCLKIMVLDILKEWSKDDK